MKFGQLLIGLLLGGLLGFGLSKYITNKNQQPANTTTKPVDSFSKSPKWLWPDSLDAMRAAPEKS
jgi:hypothetical protein